MITLDDDKIALLSLENDLEIAIRKAFNAARILTEFLIMSNVVDTPLGIFVKELQDYLLNNIGKMPRP